MPPKGPMSTAQRLVGSKETAVAALKSHLIPATCSSVSWSLSADAFQIGLRTLD